MKFNIWMYIFVNFTINLLGNLSSVWVNFWEVCCLIYSNFTGVWHHRNLFILLSTQHAFSLKVFLFLDSRKFIEPFRSPNITCPLSLLSGVPDRNMLGLVLCLPSLPIDSHIFLPFTFIFEGFLKWMVWFFTLVFRSLSSAYRFYIVYLFLFFFLHPPIFSCLRCSFTIILALVRPAFLLFKLPAILNLCLLSSSFFFIDGLFSAGKVGLYSEWESLMPWIKKFPSMAALNLLLMWT